ncbi:MAG TPA: LLM class flavin-dependent oxidoreductase [Pilimelia sp.]|nr:LLM class flavin-dependent oxidoreductase [Pilimelia sp.]
MSLHLHWFLPAHGDGREVAKTPTGEASTGTGTGTGGNGTAAGRTTARENVRRAPDMGYLAQVARAADSLGFEGALVPFGLFCEDPWLVSAALAGQTERLKFMIALRPGLASPALIAQMCATFQRVSGGRLLLNVVTGGDADEQRRYGDWLDHDARYARTAEFLDVLEQALTGGQFDHDGPHYRIAAGRLMRPHPVRPVVFVGGSSPAAQRVAARHADVFLAWGEPPPDLADLVKRVRDLAEAEGRALSFGTRFHVIARDTSAEAWQVAQRIVDGMDPAVVAKAQERFRRTESVGQRRMAALHGGRLDQLEVYPNVWAGYALARPGAGAALVGSHDEVADRIEEYHSLGLDHLILSGQPHLEEAYWFGEGVMPLLRRRGLLTEVAA